MECRLGEIIEERGMKKVWLADRAQVTRHTINLLIKGSDPHLSVAYRISNALGLSVYDIWPNLKLSE